MSTESCTHCTAEVTNGLALCSTCQQTLRVALVNVAAFHTDVLRIQPGERVKTRSTFQSTPPPTLDDAHDPISAVAENVDNMLGTWCRVLADDRPMAETPPLGAVRQCAWLEVHVPTIATLEWAGELISEVMHAEKRLQAILDRSDTGWYAGQCGEVLLNERTHDGESCVCECHNGYACSDPDICSPVVPMIAAVVCERGLYVTQGQHWITCPECGKGHDTATKREQMMTEARDHVAPVSVIAKVVVGLMDTEVSVERLTNRIDKWVSRGQLHDLGVRVLDGKPRRAYRLGDVFDLLQAQKKRHDTPSQDS